MRRRYLFFVVLCIFLVACSSGAGRVQNVQIEIETSGKFTEEELKLAMDTMTEYFYENFDRWNRLITLQYKETFSNGVIESRGWCEENTIIISSEFYAGQGFGNEAILKHMHWQLSRTNYSEPWEIVSWGKSF